MSAKSNLAAAPSDDATVRPAVKRRVVDADAHIDPPHEMWKEYLSHPD